MPETTSYSVIVQKNFETPSTLQEIVDDSQVIVVLSMKSFRAAVSNPGFICCWTLQNIQVASSRYKILESL